MACVKWFVYLIRLYRVRGNASGRGVLTIDLNLSFPAVSRPAAYFICVDIIKQNNILTATCQSATSASQSAAAARSSSSSSSKHAVTAAKASRHDMAGQASQASQHAEMQADSTCRQDSREGKQAGSRQHGSRARGGTNREKNAAIHNIGATQRKHYRNRETTRATYRGHRTHSRTTVEKNYTIAHKDTSRRDTLAGKQGVAVTHEGQRGYRPKKRCPRLGSVKRNTSAREGGTKHTQDGKQKNRGKSTEAAGGEKCDCETQRERSTHTTGGLTTPRDR